MPIDPRMVKWDETPAIPVGMVKWDDEPGFVDSAIDHVKKDIAAIPGRVGNLAAGAVRGAGSIGATLLAPFDIAEDALRGRGLSLQSNRQRRADITAGLELLGADPQSKQFQAGKLGTEIAGTLGVGGLLGNVVGRVLPSAQPAINALRTGGFRTGGGLAPAADMATRIGAGAAVGGTAAGLVSPDDLLTGVAVGGALPPAAKVVGRAAQAVARTLRPAPQEAKIARKLAQQLGVTADDLAAATIGPQRIPGWQPTVPQIVLSPVASQLQRTLKTAGANALGDAERAQQGLLRDALERIAPIDLTVQDAATRAGAAIQDFAIPAEREAAQRVTSLFDAVPSDQALMHLPLEQMQAAQTKFLGPGTFGKGGASAEQAMSTATHIGMDAATLTPRVVPFDQIQALRSSIGEAITEAQKNGRNQAAAAMTQMKNAIDNKVAEVAGGSKQPGEVFTPEAIDAWGQALDAHKAKKLQFGTGPQVGLFRQGADGQPAVQGAEIPGKFFSGRRSQVEDMQAFKRLIGDRRDLAQEMKRFAVTEGYSTSNQAGELTSKFLDWMQARSGANAQLFNPQELATLREVGRAVERSLAAENLGRVSGSDTAQKLASLNSNGLLDNRVVDVLARRVPLLGSFTGPALDGLRASAAQSRQGVMAGLLADPVRMEAALRPGRGLLDFDHGALDLLTQGAYRTLPVLAVHQ